jgi:hypothetical protein
MASRPRKFTLDDGTEVTIEWDAKLGRLAEGYARAGDHSPGRIRIAAGALRRQAQGLLLHELLHELWEKADLDRFLSQKTEELVIDSLVPWVLDTMRRNPELRDYLFDETT